MQVVEIYKKECNSAVKWWECWTIENITNIIFLLKDTKSEKLMWILKYDHFTILNSNGNTSLLFSLLTE